MLRLVAFAMVEGMVPEKLLLWSSRMVRFGRLQRGVGMAPERWFPESLSRMRLVQVPYSSGNSPVNVLLNNINLYVSQNMIITHEIDVRNLIAKKMGSYSLIRNRVKWAHKLYPDLAHELHNQFSSNMIITREIDVKKLITIKWVSILDSNHLG